MEKSENSNIYSRENFIKKLGELYNAYEEGGYILFQDYQQREIADDLIIGEGQFSKIINGSTTSYKTSILRLEQIKKIRIDKEKIREQSKTAKKLYATIAFLIAIFFILLIALMTMFTSMKSSKESQLNAATNWHTKNVQNDIALECLLFHSGSKETFYSSAENYYSGNQKKNNRITSFQEIEFNLRKQLFGAEELKAQLAAVLSISYALDSINTKNDFKRLSPSLEHINSDIWAIVAELIKENELKTNIFNEKLDRILEK